MKYIVMECHRSYAVVLAEDGRFLKVANLRYEVGQTVTNVVEMFEEPLVLDEVLEVEAKPEADDVLNQAQVIDLNERKKKTAPMRRKISRMFAGIAAMAACMVVAVTSVVNMNRTPYGSVYMTINPDVRVDVNRKNMVIGVDGLNEDGERLVDGYSYKEKALDPVMDELVDRAIEFGYLSAGGQITLSLEAEDIEWVEVQSGELKTHLNEHLEEKISVTIDVMMPEVDMAIPAMDSSAPGTGDAETKAGDISNKVSEQLEYGDSVYEVVVIDWDDEDESEDHETDGDSAYDATDGDSGYGMNDEDTSEVDGNSDYEEIGSEDGDSGYEESATVSGDSEYEDRVDEFGDSGYEEAVDEVDDSGDEEDVNGAGDSEYGEDERVDDDSEEDEEDVENDSDDESENDD